MIDRLIATAGLILIAGRTMQRCRQLNTRDDRRRPAITAEAGLRVVYEAAVAAAIVSAFFAFWTDLPVLLKTHDSATLRLVGTVLSVVGLMGFEWACRALGPQYGRCFEPGVLPDRAPAGPFRLFPHPVYVSSILMLMGAYLSSGSLWVTATASIVAMCYWRSAPTGERFPSNNDKGTGRSSRHCLLIHGEQEAALALSRRAHSSDPCRTTRVGTLALDAQRRVRSDRCRQRHRGSLLRAHRQAGLVRGGQIRHHRAGRAPRALGVS